MAQRTVKAKNRQQQKKAKRTSATAEGARVCEACGEKIETGNYTVLCYGCRWTALLPPDYQKREEYQDEPAFKHANATKRPPTGWAFLDMTPKRVRDMEPSPFAVMQAVIEGRG